MIKFVIAIALLALSVSAQAQFHSCNGCTENQYAAMALNEGLGTRYIADLTNNQATAWVVSREPIGNGKYTYFADPTTLPSNYQTGFNDWYNLEKQYQQGAQIVVTVPNPRPPGYPTQTDGQSALNWANSTQNINGMNSYLNNLQSTIMTNQGDIAWENSGLGGLGMILDLTVAQSGVSITVLSSKLEVNPIQLQIDSSEGSEITVGYNPATGAATLEKAVDRYGNTIPLNKAAVNGSKINIPQSDTNYLQKMSNYLNQQMGYTIVQAPPAAAHSTGQCVQNTQTKVATRPLPAQFFKAM